MRAELFSRWQPKMNAFLFQPVDARAVAWLRIAFALALPFFFWSDYFIRPDPVPKPLVWVYEHVIQTFCYWLAVVALCVPLAFGWRSRLFGCLLFLMLVPLDFWCPGPVSRQVLLFSFLAFLCLRSDTVRVPWRIVDRSRLHSAGPVWPVRLIQLQLTLLYGGNAVAKSSASYLRGDVLMEYSISLTSFKLDMSGGVLELGPIAIPVALAAVGSALIEYFLATAFWFGRWKWIAAIVGIVFHWLLTFILTIFKLNFASIFLYLAFLLPLIPDDPAVGRPGSKIDPMN